MRPVLFLLAALALAGCGEKAPEGGPAIRIEDRAYAPSGIAVPPGAVVHVENGDDATHTVTGSGFDTRDVPAHGSGSFTAPSAAGAYPFTCAYHPEMQGTLTVA